VVLKYVFCKYWKAWAEVSAREGTNITAAMQLLIEQIVQNAKKLSSVPSSGSQKYSASSSSTSQIYETEKNTDHISESKSPKKHKSPNSQIHSNNNTTFNNQNNTIKLTKENHNQQKRARTSQRQQTECAC
jgi:hypothetical protein